MVSARWCSDSERFVGSVDLVLVRVCEAASGEGFTSSAETTLRKRASVWTKKNDALLLRISVQSATRPPSCLRRGTSER